MGCTQNFTEDKKFMLEYYEKQKDFLADTPLFDVDEIKFPLSTSGMKIVDSNGKRVKLSGVNWSGCHAERHCVGGLDYQPLEKIVQCIREVLDFNVIRLTFSLQMFYDNNVISQKLISANPKLFGKKSMEIFDETIKVLTQAKIMVCLNNHTSKSQWCCSNSDGDGLWWTKQYSEQQYFNCLKQMAKRYSTNQLVIGIDLRNEIRKANGLTPTWGDGNPKTDWRQAAQKIGNDLQKIAPHWLIIVGGLSYQLDFTKIYQNPIQLEIPNKLIYSGHLFAFSWPSWVILWKRIGGSYQRFYQTFFKSQTFIRNLGEHGIPFILGQFGCNCQDRYWNHIIKFIQNTDIDWFYWCLDGYKCVKQEDQTFGILSKDFSSIRNKQMLKELQMIGKKKNITNSKRKNK